MPTDDNDLRESPLSPADDERIRRLLADARHTEAMPASVATRLDEVLADLAAERRDRDAGQPAPRRHDATVVDLAARRRRTATNLLVAAAAVIAVGIGISQVLPDGLSGGSDMGTAQDEANPEAAPADSGGGEDEGAKTPDSALVYGEAVVIRSERFGADVRKARARVTGGDVEVYSDEDANRPESPREGCVGVDPGPGIQVPAVYDGALAVLVLRPASGEVQVVDLYLCGDIEPRRSITLTAP
jgi:hypothetical protein